MFRVCFVHSSGIISAWKKNICAVVISGRSVCRQLKLAPLFLPYGTLSTHPGFYFVIVYSSSPNTT
jgi:hypothetical protein